MRKYLPFLALLIWQACRNEAPDAAQDRPADTRFERLDAASSGVDFLNKVENGETFNIFRYRNFYNGGGVAIGDINNDGLPDIYFSSNQGPNKLYLNKGNFQFEDISEKAGVGGTKAWSTGVVMVDLNADGWLDIYVCNAGYLEGDDQENELFINNGDLTFTEKAAEYNLNEGGYTTHTAFFDYDLDGDLDAYILNNSFIPVSSLNLSNERELDAEDWDVPEFFKGGGDKLLRNDGGKFVDVTDAAGIYSSLIGFGLGIAVGDVNADGWPDMYISNDFYERDYLYINQKDGSFEESITDWMPHISLFSMGADMADVNNDGYPELFATDMLPDEDERLKATTVFETYNVYTLKQARGFYHQFMHNTLQLNNRDGSFSEVAHFAGVAASDWSWGALMFDADNDGYRDIFVCNGIYHDLTNQDFINFFANDVIQKLAINGKREEVQNIIAKMPSTPIPNRFFHNQKNLTFKESAKDWGLGEPSFSNGAAYADLDNDGDLDLVVNNVNQPAMLYRNHSQAQTGHHYLKVRLRAPAPNTYAIGAKAYGYRGGDVFFAEMIPTRGFQSSVDYTLHFGLGPTAGLDSLAIVWPDGTRSSLAAPPVDTLLGLDYNTLARSKARVALPQAPARKALREVAQPFAAHQEDRFVDFFQEGLVMRMVSREGPRAAVGDLNGDGLDDVCIGAAAGFPTQVWLQQRGGKFVPAAGAATFDRSSYYEDTALALFDADGDGDLDLYAGSGGNLPGRDAQYLQDRLFLNDGKGRFEWAEEALPRALYNTAVVLPWDMDGDGDLDLLVGSRSIAGEYGSNPPHFIYENKGKGQFADATAQRGAALQDVGMMTDALLADVLGDAAAELVLLGDWMAPQVFALQGGKLVKQASNLDGFKGWWYGLRAADVDGDGDQDLIAGNRGENFLFSASAEAPAKLWVAEFAANGSRQKIMTRQIKGRDLPLPMKDEITAQIPWLKKQNLKHSDYAKRSIQELFPKELLDKALVKEATYFKSAVFLNQGGGQFSVEALPDAVQLSCVCGIYCGDLNGDGLADLVLGGNDHGFTPQYSQLDASRGQVLLNTGKGRFEVATASLGLRGDVKQILPIRVGQQPHLLWLINGQAPKLFKVGD